MFGDCEVERCAIEGTYEGKMALYGYVAKKRGYETYEECVLLQDNIPCALVKHKLPVSSDDDVICGTYTAKVFCAPELVVKAGSVIKIYQDGKEYQFCHSGDSFVYATHQELLVEKVY